MPPNFFPDWLPEFAYIPFGIACIIIGSIVGPILNHFWPKKKKP